MSNTKDPAVKKWLQKLAKSTGRSRSFLAAKAINDYLGLNEWQVSGIQRSRDRREAVFLFVLKDQEEGIG